MIILEILSMFRFQGLLSSQSSPAQSGQRDTGTVVHFAHFQVQARKRGILGWGYVHISKRGVWLLSWEQGWGWYSGQLGKMWPHSSKMRLIWAICSKSGQICSTIEKNNSIIWQEQVWQNWPLANTSSTHWESLPESKCFSAGQSSRPTSLILESEAR